MLVIHVLNQNVTDALVDMEATCSTGKLDLKALEAE